MNIIKFELKQNIKSVLWWNFGIALVCIMFFSMIPMFMEQAETLNDMFATMNSAFLDAFNINLETFMSPLGFYSYIFMYISMAGMIMAIILGMKLYSKEFVQKADEFLFVKPVSRSAIYTSKFIVGVILIIGSGIFYVVTSRIIMHIFNDFEINDKLFVLISNSFLYLQILAYALGIAIAVIVRKVKGLVGTGVGIIIMFFVISMLQGVLDEDKLAYFTPFRYFDTQYIMDNGGYDMNMLYLNFAITFVLLLVSYVTYIKRDING